MGFYYFRQLKSGSYDLHTVEETKGTDKVFWSIFEKTEKKVALIDIPDLKIIPNLKGIQLYNWAVHNSHYIPPVSYPNHLLSSVNKTFGKPDNITENFNSNFAEDQRIYKRLLKRLRKKGELCRNLCSQNEYDVIMAVFGECHTGGHQLWKYRPEAQGDDKVSQTELTNGIRDIYQAIDEEIGLMLKELPQNANICLVSSVGLVDRYSTEGLIIDFCQQLGYQVPTKSNINLKSPLSLLRSFIPEKLRLSLSKFLPRDVKERLLADNFRNGTNWSKTTAFAIPSAYMSFIRVNLRGREPQGIISQGAEYDAILKQLEADLNQLIDPRSGKKAVRKVWYTNDLFGSDRTSELPDLFVDWQPLPYFMEKLHHPQGELTQKKPEFYRGSDHTHEGFIAFSGESIPLKGNLGEIPILSIAPTFVSLIGEKIPHWMKFSPLW
jgi:predicted AlkP superfamily phosphohydrolase/phosphomutase